MANISNGKYRTTQGDMWDSIAKHLYGSGNEKLMHVLIDANPQYRNIAVFSANCELVVPDVSIETRITWPPWRAR